jgi:hypothetical protein
VVQIQAPASQEGRLNQGVRHQEEHNRGGRNQEEEHRLPTTRRKERLNEEGRLLRLHPLLQGSAS